MIEKSVGESKAMNICEILNSQAPLTIRVNPTKIERDIVGYLYSNTLAL